MTKFCKSVDTHDLITCATFCDDRLRGLGVARGQISRFPPLTCVVALKTLSHYRASVWQDNWQLAKIAKFVVFDSSCKFIVLRPLLNYRPITNISLISVLLGLETSPNIFKWGELSFATTFVALRLNSNFDPLSRLYDLLELWNL